MERESNGKKKRVNPLLAFTAIVSVCCLCCCITLLVIAVFRLGETRPAGQIQDATTQETNDNTDGGETSNTEIYTEEQYLLAISEARTEATNEAKAELKSEIKNMYMNSASIVDSLRQLYPEDIVYYHNGGYQFVPINPAYDVFPYNQDNLVVADNQEISYSENGEVVSVKGIDLSKYQEDVEWDKVAASGVEYAMIRVGIRGYGTGEIVMDTTFEDNVKGALSENIDVGVYFFSQAVNKEEAIEEANFVLEAIAPYNITYPVVLDIEELTDPSARTASLTPAERTDIAIAFLETIREAGYTPMIYGNLKSFFTMLEYDRIQQYDRWFAFYDTFLYFPYDIKMWQYTDKGSVDGIKGDVDLNIMFQAQEWEHP